MTLTNHGFLNGQAVAISGAAQPEYNGGFAITVLNANTFTYTVSAAPSRRPPERFWSNPPAWPRKRRGGIRSRPLAASKRPI